MIFTLKKNHEPVLKNYFYNKSHINILEMAINEINLP